ncbi:MAG: ABC transporter ATP-binding protein [Elusimicrobiota bacterium]|nr:ABC transporter ATP-binding protein [Elusimicrobiota bacterium]
MTDKALKIENVKKCFGATAAVDTINLEVEKGTIFGILGPNGAGKTTTIRMMAGLLKPDCGRILIGGKDIVKNSRRAKRKFALIPDVPYIYKKVTGWEFMKFIAAIYDMDSENIDEEIDKQLKVFSVDNVACDLVESYSHGLRQRLLLASVMMRDPEIIILDEPMVGLDPEAARMVKDIFFKLRNEKSRTIFLSTHTLTDAHELCDRIAIITKGQIIAEGTFEELKAVADKISRQAGLSTAGAASLEEVYLQITRNT